MRRSMLEMHSHHIYMLQMNWGAFDLNLLIVFDAVMQERNVTRAGQKIGLSQPMFEGVGLDVLANGPGHWTGTAMPGDNGNTVVAGHRVTHTHPFLDIDQLQPGDQVIFTTGAGRFVYAVTQTFIVTPDATWIANPTTDPTITLFACHPKHEKTHRIVVTGHLISAQRTAPPPPPPHPAAPPPPPPRPGPAPAPSSPPPASTTNTTQPPQTQPRCTGWLCLSSR